MWLEPKAATSRRFRSGMGLPTPAWSHAIGKSLLSSGPPFMAYRRLPGAMSATDQSFGSSSSMAMAMRVESVLVEGLAHAFPIRTDGASSCGQVGDFVVATDVCAATEIARFWGLPNGK
jgi:hypothetical protein